MVHKGFRLLLKPSAHSRARVPIADVRPYVRGGDGGIGPQDHPEIAKVTQQNSGARRLGQTGKLYVEIEVTYNKGLEPGSKRKGEVVHRWESSERFARRVRDNMGQLEGCMLGGLGGGSQRQATWAHPDSSSTTSLRVRLSPPSKQTNHAGPVPQHQGHGVYQ